MLHAGHRLRPDQQRTGSRTEDCPVSRAWARRVDTVQTGAESRTVLADPEGNEFCMTRPKETLTR
ncbi:MAG: VOC family protein [Streptosporangiaceae bacterium]